MSYGRRRETLFLAFSALQMTKSGLTLVVTGTSTGRVVMLEAEADNLDHALFVDGVACGLQA